jgi:hypothetical protein
VFVQVIQGQVTDARLVNDVLDDWAERLAPGAQGWLGTTAGVVADGTFLCTSRFSSAQAARRNSDRALQGEWWSGLSKAFSGDVVFHDCTEVDVARGGGSDRAGYVQVIQARTDDVPGLRWAAAMLGERFPDVRPDLLGYITCVHDGENGAFTQVAYFTSELEARVAEREEPPAEVAECLRRERELMHDLRVYDVRKPLLYSPR